MPIQDRKYFIQKHNIESKREMENMDSMNGNNERVTNGAEINTFAAMEQAKK